MKHNRFYIWLIMFFAALSFVDVVYPAVVAAAAQEQDAQEKAPRNEQEKRVAYLDGNNIKKKPQPKYAYPAIKHREQQKRKQKTVNELRKAQRKISQQELIAAILGGDVQAAVKAVKAGAQANKAGYIKVKPDLQKMVPAYFSEIRSIYLSPITLAAILQRFDILKALFDLGYSINHIDEHGRSLIARVIYLAPEVSLEYEPYIATIVTWLINHGADLNWRDHPRTLLIFAAERNLPVVTGILLKEGANPDLDPLDSPRANFRAQLSGYSPAVQKVWADFLTFKQQQKAAVKQELDKKEPRIPLPVQNLVTEYL